MDYLPGYSFSDEAYGRLVTTRHLLSHTSGLPMAGKDWGPRDPHALKRYVWEELAHHRFVVGGAARGAEAARAAEMTLDRFPLDQLGDVVERRLALAQQVARVGLAVPPHQIARGVALIAAADLAFTAVPIAGVWLLMGFGFIGVGGTIGAMVGSGLTGLLVETVSTANMLIGITKSIERNVARR